MKDLILAIRLSQPRRVKACGDLEAIREKSATYRSCGDLGKSRRHFREGEREKTATGLAVRTHLCLSTTLLRLHRGVGICPEIPRWEESEAWCHTLWSLSLERGVTL